MDLPSESHYKEYGLFTFMEGGKCITDVFRLAIMAASSGTFSFLQRKCRLSYAGFPFLLENVMVPVKVTDYIMDVVGTMERQGIKFSLCFRRVLWLQGLRLDNELLVSVIYYQVRADKQVSPSVQLRNERFFAPLLLKHYRANFALNKNGIISNGIQL